MEILLHSYVIKTNFNNDIKLAFYSLQSSVPKRILLVDVIRSILVREIILPVIFCKSCILAALV